MYVFEFYTVGKQQKTSVNSHSVTVTKKFKNCPHGPFRYIFSSNQIVLKISFSLCFWAPDLLFDRF